MADGRWQMAAGWGQPALAVVRIFAGVNGHRWRQRAAGFDRVAARVLRRGERRVRTGGCSGGRRREDRHGEVPGAFLGLGIWSLGFFLAAFIFARSWRKSFPGSEKFEMTRRRCGTNGRLGGTQSYQGCTSSPTSGSWFGGVLRATA